MNATFRQAFKRDVPVAIGYITLAIAFAMFFLGSGYPWWLALLLSLCVYSGTLQFLCVSFLAGMAISEIILLTILMNLRHMFYGLSMLGRYRHHPQKLYLIFTLTDETYALLTSQKTPEGLDDRQTCLYVSMFNHIAWFCGTAIGCLLYWLAGFLPGFDSSGIEFCLCALFVVLAVDQWLSIKDHKPAWIGILAGGIGLFFGSQFLLVALAIILAGLLYLQSQKPEANHE